MKTNLHKAKPEHEVAYQDIVALCSKHAAVLSKMEVLAIAANMVGKLIALQDQRKVTPDQAMKVVFENIEYGNETVICELSESKGNG